MSPTWARALLSQLKAQPVVQKCVHLYHIQCCAAESLSFSVWKQGWHAHFHGLCQVTNIMYLHTTLHQNSQCNFRVCDGFPVCTANQLCQDQGHHADLTSMLSRLFLLHKDQKHIRKKSNTMKWPHALISPLEGQGFIMRLTKEQSSGRETCIKGTFPISKGRNRSSTILMGSFQTAGPWC